MKQVTKLHSHMKSQGSTTINSIIDLLCEQVDAIMEMYNHVNANNASSTNDSVLHQFSTLLPALLCFADCCDIWGTSRSLCNLCLAMAKICSTTIYIANKSRSASNQDNNININGNTDD